MFIEACIIGAPFYQTSKPNINVVTRVCALATKAVKFVTKSYKLLIASISWQHEAITNEYLNKFQLYRLYSLKCSDEIKKAKNIFDKIKFLALTISNLVIFVTL